MQAFRGSRCGTTNQHGFSRQVRQKAAGHKSCLVDYLQKARAEVLWCNPKWRVMIMRMWRQARHKQKVDPAIYLCRPAHYVKDVGGDQKAWVVQPQFVAAPEGEEVQIGRAHV